MTYIELTVLNVQQATIDILIAKLSDIGYEGFEEENSLIRAYIIKEDYKEELTNDIISNLGLVSSNKDIEQQNWNATWESSFEPVVVNEFCAIRADFHSPEDGVLHDIIVTPKMSFGTGHHATTRLMVEQMADLSIEGKSVLDFGTGTGVLAILAHKLKAESISAIDNDEWSYENVLENMERNDIDDIAVLKGSLEVVSEQKYDVILANINRHILIEYMTSMYEQLNDGGKLLLSGILDQDVDVISNCAEKVGLHLSTINSEGNWRCIMFTK